MKTKTIWALVGAAVVGVVLWVFVRRNSSPVYVQGGLPNTGTSYPLDFLNPLRTQAQANGVALSNAQRNVATINAVAQATPAVVKGVQDLFGLFRTTPKTTTGTLNGLNAVDFTPTPITKADAYFYA